jgi:hypothetical protein
MLRVVATANFPVPFDKGKKVKQNFKAPLFATLIHSYSFNKQQPALGQY